MRQSCHPDGVFFFLSERERKTITKSVTRKARAYTPQANPLRDTWRRSPTTSEDEGVSPCVLVYVFPHSLPAALVLHLGQAHRSVELPQLACCSGIWAQRHSIRVFRCRTWQPIHSSMFLQLCRIWVLHTCPEKFSTRAWQHRLTTWTEQEPIALMRRLTNAHDGKTDICFIVSDLKLATISQTKT